MAHGRSPSLVPLPGSRPSPHQGRWCRINRLACPVCDGHLNKDNARFVLPGGFLRCGHRPAQGHGACGTDVYMLPAGKVAWLCAVTYEQIAQIEREIEQLREREGRDADVIDVLRLLGALYVPKDLSRESRMQR